MRLIRVYTPGPLRTGATVRLGDAAAAHVSRVLRLRAGDPLTLFNGDGLDYAGTVSLLRGDQVEVGIASHAAGLPDSPLDLTLAQGVARGERMDLVIQKATELGVSRIVPLLTGRSVVRLDGEQAKRKLDHWRAVAIAACEQCGRSRLPLIDAPRTLEEWLAAPDAPACRVLLAPAAPQPLRAVTPASGAVAVLIGPEGGLTEAERASAIVAGYEPRSLGPRVLRTETAALVALAVLQSSSGDLR
jgi:16S rRNA (uracil1498-N3)-methyltransferase